MQARVRQPLERRRGCLGAPGRRVGWELWFVLVLSCPVGGFSDEGQQLHQDGGAWMEVFKTPGRKSQVWTLRDGSRVRGVGAETGQGQGKDQARENRREGSWPEEVV